MQEQETAAVVPEEKPLEKPLEKPPEEKEITIVDVKADVTKANSISYAKSFTVTWKNKETGVVNVGTFTAVRPGLGTLGKIGVLRAQLNGGQVVDQMTDSNHSMMADLHYCLTNFPDWWRPDEFFTATPLWEVWTHVNTWLATFRPRSAG